MKLPAFLPSAWLSPLVEGPIYHAIFQRPAYTHAHLSIWFMVILSLHVKEIYRLGFLLHVFECRPSVYRDTEKGAESSSRAALTCHHQPARFDGKIYGKTQLTGLLGLAGWLLGDDSMTATCTTLKNASQSQVQTNRTNERPRKKTSSSVWNYHFLFIAKPVIQSELSSIPLQFKVSNCRTYTQPQPAKQSERLRAKS